MRGGVAAGPQNERKEKLILLFECRRPTRRTTHRREYRTDGAVSDVTPIKMLQKKNNVTSYHAMMMSHATIISTYACLLALYNNSTTQPLYLYSALSLSREAIFQCLLLSNIHA